MHRPEGSHLIVELSGGDYRQLNDKAGLEALAHSMAEAAGAKTIKVFSHDFEPEGVSVLLMLEESHISIHTYPEWGYAAIDIFTCGKTNPFRALAHLSEHLTHRYLEINKLWRGMNH